MLGARRAALVVADDGLTTVRTDVDAIDRAPQGDPVLPLPDLEGRKRALLALEAEAELEPARLPPTPAARLPLQIAAQVGRDRLGDGPPQRFRATGRELGRQLLDQVPENPQRVGQRLRRHWTLKLQQDLLQGVVHVAAANQRLGLGAKLLGLKLALDQ